MKIEQKPKFQPITIILETAEEAELFWKLIAGMEGRDAGTATEHHVKQLRHKISDWFSNEAQLGGNP